VSAPVLERRPAGSPAGPSGPTADGISIRATGTLVPGIRGREAETAVLDDAIDRAAAGRLAVVLIDGEAGIGKTWLLEAVLERARRRGLRVAAGRAAELERTRPFGLIAGMFGCTRSAPASRPGRPTHPAVKQGGREHLPGTSAGNYCCIPCKLS
jgi:hypothetical protein